MYRRIEVNGEGICPAFSYEEKHSPHDMKVFSIMNTLPEIDGDKIEELEMKGVSGLFFFTELGWTKWGSSIYDIIKRWNIQVKVIEVSETTPTVLVSEEQVMIDYLLFKERK